MTSKEALNDIKKRNNALREEGHFPIETKVMSVIEDLVSRDTPMKPIIDEDDGYCPMCNNIVWKNFWYYYQDKYFCSRCGQRLDWS